MQLHLTNIYRVPPHSSKIIFDESSGIFPVSFKNYVVRNVGRTEVFAEALYGTGFGWIGPVGAATVQPLHTETVNNGGKLYYRVGLQIHNRTNVSAIVSATYTDGSFPNHNNEGFDQHYDTIIKSMVVFGVKFVPYVGPTVSGLLNAFWPSHKPNVWEQIRDKVQILVNDSIRNAVNAILSGDIRHYQERIKVLQTQINSDSKRNASTYYMNLAQDMIGLELKFTYPEDKYTSYVLLPLYTAVVMMKMNYYVVGIAKPNEIGLTAQDVNDLRTFANRLIEDRDGVVTYINNMYRERLDTLYDSWGVRDIYNAMMNTRSFIAVNGLEYIPVWRKMLADPMSAQNAYIDAVSYSEFYGRETPMLCMEATPAEPLKQPFTPALINGRRNKMRAVELFMWRINNGAGAPKIGGLKVYFENGDNYKMGWSSNETHYIDFRGAYLVKLRVAGNYALDTFTFFFSDGREETYGTPSNVDTVFELKDHNIASIFLSNDDRDLGGQGAGVAVSYVQM